MNYINTAHCLLRMLWACYIETSSSYRKMSNSVRPSVSFAETLQWTAPFSGNSFESRCLRFGSETFVNSCDTQIYNIVQCFLLSMQPRASELKYFSKTQVHSGCCCYLWQLNCGHKKWNLTCFRKKVLNALLVNITCFPVLSVFNHPMSMYPQLL